MTDTGTVVLIGSVHDPDVMASMIREAIERHDPDVVALEAPPADATTDETALAVGEALDPGPDATLRGVLFERLATAGGDPDGDETRDTADEQARDGDIVSEDAAAPSDDYVAPPEVPYAARAAADHGASVALVDQPYAETMDRYATAVGADLLRAGETLVDGLRTHGELLADRDWDTLLWRDLDAVDDVAVPLARYERLLVRNGQVNPLDREGTMDAMESMSMAETRSSVDHFGDVLETLVPHFVGAVGDDRDEHMAGRIQWLREQGHDVLAVFGMAHMDGIRGFVEEPATLPDDAVAAPPVFDPSGNRWAGE